MSFLTGLKSQDLPTWWGEVPASSAPGPLALYLSICVERKEFHIIYKEMAYPSKWIILIIWLCMKINNKNRATVDIAINKPAFSTTNVRNRNLF